MNVYCVVSPKVLKYCSLCVCVLLLVALHLTPLSAQDEKPKPKPTREQILKMKIDELLELPLEEVMDLVKIAGVSSLEELINLIVTTASKSEEKLQDAGAIISIVTSKEIQDYGALSVMEILDRITSVYTLGSYLYPKNIVSIRGNNTANFNTNVLVLLNGRPMRESYGNGYNASIYNGFPVDRIERIEVIRGPGSVLYGTCAMTGVINVITKDAAAQGPLNFSARYGSFGTLQAGVSAGTAIDELQITGGANYYRSDGWDFTARGERDSLTQTPTTIKAYETTFGADLMVKYKGFKLHITDTFTEQASISRNAMWAGSPPRIGPIDFKSSMNRLFIDAGYEAELSDMWTLTANVTYNANEVRIGRPALANDRDEPGSSDFLIEITNFFKPAPKLNIIVGALTNIQSGKHIIYSTIASDTSVFGVAMSTAALNNPSTPLNSNPFYLLPQYNQTWWSAYFQADYTIGDIVKIIGGGQLNKVTGLDLDFVPRLGAVISLSSSLGIKLLYAQAFRSASGFERGFLGAIGGQIIGNPDLLPEKITTLEAQVRYAESNYEITATYFHSNQTDVISRSLPSENLAKLNGVVRPGLATYLNRGTLQTSGFEAEGKINITSKFSINASASYQTTKDNSGVVDNLGMPQLMIKTGVRYATPFGLTLSAFNSYYGKGGSISTAQTRNLNPAVEAFSYLSFKVSYDIVELFNSVTLPSMVFSVYATNLLDAAVYYPEYVRRNMNSIPGRPGRGIFASFEVRLQ